MIISSLLLVALLASGSKALAQSDTSRVAQTDSSAYNPNAIAEGQKQIADFLQNHVGFDIYVTGETYTLHLGRVGFFSLTGGGGLGAELRFRPVFAGVVAVISSHEMRPRPSYPFTSLSLYAGALINKYRVEIGEIHGTYFGGNSQGEPGIGFDTYFAGLSKRYGSNSFIEPEIRLMFPVSAGYYIIGPPSYNVAKIEHYTMGDLFVSFSVKLGIGVGYCQ